MKKFNKLFKISILALFVLVFASCGKTGNSYDVIPKDATLVVVANGKALSQKTGIDNITKTNTFALIKDQLDDEETEGFKAFEPIFEEPAESGIDFNKDYMFFSYRKKNVNYIAFYFDLLDAKKFEAMVNKINETEENGLTISKDEGFSYLFEEEDSPFQLL